ncbi:hypothetical protein EVAR_43062_1 [Eumeta japonica]|uniref:Uncharacterized protein n=1 Tax=Eumeta variegata TaxID=151549 RepID=A0A4C1WV55_EUMVA|nr:hypothetical protein EVAR_43062_1 [Eumeta japonica]
MTSSSPRELNARDGVRPALAPVRNIDVSESAKSSILQANEICVIYKVSHWGRINVGRVCGLGAVIDRRLQRGDYVRDRQLNTPSETRSECFDFSQKLIDHFVCGIGLESVTLFIRKQRLPSGDDYVCIVGGLPAAEPAVCPTGATAHASGRSGGAARDAPSTQRENVETEKYRDISRIGVNDRRRVAGARGDERARPATRRKLAGNGHLPNCTIGRPPAPDSMLLPIPQSGWNSTSL